MVADPKPEIARAFDKLRITELGAIYRITIINRALVETRRRGVMAMIQAKLGKDGLAEIRRR